MDYQTRQTRKRQQERRKRQLQKASENTQVFDQNLSANSEPVDEADCFISLRALMDDIHKGKRVNVVFYDRASTENQRDSPQSRWTPIKSILDEGYGDRIIIKEKFLGEIADGRSDMLGERVDLWKAVELCQKTGWYLLAPCVNRVIRPEAYDPKKNPFCRLLEKDLDRLKERLHGMMIATVYPPGGPPEWVHGWLSGLGQKARGKKGGRPPKPKKMTRQELTERKKKFGLFAWERSQVGWDARDICVILSGYECFVSHRTVCRWIQQINEAKRAAKRVAPKTPQKNRTKYR